MKTSTARIDGVMTISAQNVSDFSHARRDRRRDGARIERGATTSPPTTGCKRDSAEPGELGGLYQALLSRGHIACGSERVDHVHVVSGPALLGREPMRDAWRDDVRREVLHRGVLVRVVTGTMTGVYACRDRALQRIEGILTSHRAGDLEPRDGVVAIHGILRQAERVGQSQVHAAGLW